MFSGAYLNKFTVSMAPSDRIARGKGPTRLGASLPEDGHKASFQNQTLCFFNKLHGVKKKKKSDCFSWLYSCCVLMYVSKR